MHFVDIKNDIAFRKIFGNENKKYHETFSYLRVVQNFASYKMN